MFYSRNQSLPPNIINDTILHCLCLFSPLLNSKLETVLPLGELLGFHASPCVPEFHLSPVFVKWQTWQYLFEMLQALS